MKRTLPALSPTGPQPHRDRRTARGLEHQLHAAADHIEIATRADRVEQLGQVKLTEGHRPSPS
jgi:hypothetical protein